MHWIALINFTAAIQGFFLVYLLVNHKPHRKEYRLLALLILVMSVAILGPVLGISGYYRQFPHLIRIGDPLVLLFGPLLYFYIRLLTKGSLPKRYPLHLVPFVLYLVSLIPFYAMSGEEKIVFGEQVFLNEKQNLLVVYIQVVRLLHVGAYIVISLLLIRRFQRLLRDHFSDIHKINLDKSNFLLRLYLLIALLSAGIYLISLLIPINFVLVNSIIALAISLVIYAVAYSTWNRPGDDVYQPVMEPLYPNALPAEEVGGVVQEKLRSNHHISDAEYGELATRLEKLLEEEKVFLDGDLSLAQLSAQLGIPPYQMSELISRRYQEHFFDVINRHRVEEVQRRLHDPSFGHYSILGIAMASGFNTKSSFNTAFKKFTGLTPSQYRQQRV